MTPSEIYQPLCSYFNNTNSYLHIDNDNLFCIDDEIGNCWEFSPPLGASEDTFDTSFPFTYPEDLLCEEYMELPAVIDRELDGVLSVDNFLLDLEDFDLFTSDEKVEESTISHHHQPSVENDCEWNLEQPMNSNDVSLVLPIEGKELDNQLGVVHLLMAFVEAMERQEMELAEVIAKRIGEKVSPVGEILERLLYYLFLPLDKQADCLRQESFKNFYPAFKAFYQIFPNGKFAHFAANLAILETIPDDAGIINIIDFDIGEGIQWASLMDAVAQQQKEIRLTAITGHEGNSCCNQMQWRFDDTRKQLLNHAKACGLKLEVQEMNLQELATETKKMSTRCSRGKEWFAFNCMVGLPHMGRTRNRMDISKFLTLAKDFLHHANEKSIITFGDGEAWEELVSTASYASFFDVNISHYQALLESIEFKFPAHLVQARTVLECLFVAPFVSFQPWAQKWEERKLHGDLKFGYGLEGCEVSEVSLMEAQQMLRGENSLYGVRIEGEKSNMMVMDWRGVPLVRVSCWRR